MIPHGGMPYESLVISGRIIGTDIKPGSLSGAVSISGSIKNEAIEPKPLSSFIETIVTKQFNAALPIPENAAVYVTSTGFLGLALASASGTMPSIGIAKSAGSGVQVTVIRHGIKEGIVTSAPQNTPFYVSELSSGVLTEVIPATGFIQRMGHALYLSGQVMVSPDPFYYNTSGFPMGVVVA